MTSSTRHRSAPALRCACGRRLEGRNGPGAFNCPGGLPLRRCVVCRWPDHEDRGDVYAPAYAGGWICDDCANVDAGTPAA